MGSPSKPKWGYESRDILGHDGVQAYSAEEIAALADKYDVAGAELREEFRLRLEGAGNV